MAVGQKDFAEKRPDQLVYLEIGSGNGGMLLSISESGFRFRAVAAMRANGPVPFAFSLDGSNRLEGTGEIDWLEDDAKSGGLRFTDVSADFRASVRRWLTGNGLPAPSPREYAPAAAKPADTLEKIRQELRSGYPTSRKPQSQPITESVAQPETAPKKTPTPANVGEAAAISRTRQTESVIAPSMFSGAAVEPAETDKEAAPSSAISSAFLKPRRESQPSFHPSPFVTQPESLPEFLEPEVARHSEEIHEESASVAGEPQLVPSTPVEEPRPYIPPLEESFEEAWQRARLSAQPEPSRLSRAAASSIIALALCVILGALGYSYRQDIGSFVIDLGQKISGDKSAPSGTDSSTKVQATPATSGSSEEKTATQSSPPENDSHAADLQRTAAPPQPSASSTALDAVDPKTTAGSSPESTKIPDASENNNASTAKDLGRPSPSTTNKPVTNNIPSPATKALNNAAAQPPIEVTAKAGAAIESETGQTEFNLARDILRGNGRQRDLSKAVDLLWNGVKKGYVPAEVTLADLYLRGDGVEKSCDQARILLVAASKKGSPDARQKLEKLAEQGCE